MLNTTDNSHENSADEPNDIAVAEGRYEDLLRQKSELEQRIATSLAEIKPQIIQKLRATIRQYAITPEELFPGVGLGSARRGRTAGTPKYRDPVTGKTWSGHGRAPAWIVGKNREEFRIATGV